MLGETSARFLDGELQTDELTRSYAKRWRDNFAGRFAWSAIFRRFLLSSGLGAVGGRLAGRSLALFAVSRLRAPSLPPA